MTNLTWGIGLLLAGIGLLCWFGRGLRRGDETGNVYESMPGVYISEMVVVSAMLALVLGIVLLARTCD